MSEQANANPTAPEHSDGMLKIGLNLAAIGLVAGMILSVVNYFTEPIRIQNEIEARKAARRNVLPAAEDFKPIEGLDQWFRGIDGQGELVGYVMPIIQRGYDGNMFMMLGVDKDMNVVKYKILKDRETPGLGAKAKEDWFIEQFKGRDKNELEVSKVEEKGKITAITGATITSRAVANGIKHMLEKLETLAADDFKTIPDDMKKKEGSHE